MASLPVYALLFFLSGLSALIYQVIWVSHFSTTFGGTAAAIGTVVATFMAGLSIGSWLFGRVVDRRPRPLGYYGLLELGIAAYAAVFPLVLMLIDRTYTSLVSQPGTWQAMLLITLLSACSMLFPTVLMGGTLPALAAAVRRNPSGRARSIGTLYATNTFGAVAGTVLAGFVLLPVFGDLGSLAIACGLNLLVGAAALLISRYKEALPAAAGAVAGDGPRPRAPMAPALVSFGCGLAGLGLEIVWIRVLAMILGTTTYAFSTMLGVYLLTFSLGTLFSARFLVGRRPSRGKILVGVLLLTGISAALTIPVFNRLPALFLEVFPRFADPWWKLTFAQSLLSGLVFVVPCFLMGTGFPLILHLAAPGEQEAGRVTGRIYAWNTAGCIVGAALSGHVLIPWLGLERSIHVFSALFLFLPLFLVGFAAGRRSVWRTAAGAAAAALGFALLVRGPTLDRKAVADGVYFGARAKVQDPAYRLGDFRSLYYAEGVESTVEVRESMTHQRIEIAVNGKEVALTTYDDMRLQRFMGHLPAILHGDPKTSVVIGLGAGVTFGSAYDHTGPGTLCIEMERVVIPAARLFGAANGFVVDKAEDRIVLADGRNFLRLTDRTFDVITSDPFHPIVRGSSRLYTRDFFATARGRLNPGGVMAQYLPLYQLAPDDVRMIARTFADVFPYVSMWFTNIDTILVGSETPLRIDVAALKAALARGDYATPLAPINLGEPYAFLSSFVMHDRLREYCGEGPLNTDNHLRLEYSSGRSMYADTVGANIEEIARYRESVVPYLAHATPEDIQALERWHAARSLAMRARACARSQPAESIRLAEEALSLVPEDRDTAHALADTCAYLGRSALEAGLVEQAHDVFARGLEVLGDQDEALRSRLLASQANALVGGGRFDEGIACGRQALATNPDSTLALFAIGSAHLQKGEFQQAAHYFERVLELNPIFSPALVDLGICYGRGASDWERAAVAARRALEIDPDDMKARYTYGLWCAAMAEDFAGKDEKKVRALQDEALRQWDAVLQSEPDNDAVRKLRDELLRKRS